LWRIFLHVAKVPTGSFAVHVFLTFLNTRIWKGAGSGVGDRGRKRNPKNFDLSKIPENPGTGVSTPLFSLCYE